MTERALTWSRPAMEEQVEKVERRLTLLPPDPKAWDPFILFGEDTFGKDAFTWHPHRGFETVTYVIDGVLEHQDSHDNRGQLGPGDIEWNTAGSGIFHEEQPIGGNVRALQLWLNLPAAQKMMAPHYQELRRDEMPTIRGGSATLRVYAGTIGGVTGPAATITPATVAVLQAEGHGELALGLPQDHVVCIYVIDGALEIAGSELRAGDVAWSDAAPGTLQVHTNGPCHAIILSGKPLREPAIFDAGFVMNTREQIDEAKADLEAGRFAQISAEAAS